MSQIEAPIQRSSVRKANTQRRHNQIRAEFGQMTAQRKYLSSYIIATLALRYNLAERTVEGIVYTD